jgi:hypothetical protein
MGNLFLRDLMTDLLLQDLVILVSEKLNQILRNERREMLGEKRPPSKGRTVNRLCSRSVAGSVIEIGKGGGKRCCRVKS